jgi:hypothetical protein
MTVLIKFVIEPLCVVLIAVISLAFFAAAVRDAIHGPSVSRLDAISVPLMVVFLALLIGGPVSYLILRQALLLKEVSVDKDFLYVSNFRREIKVPLSEVVSVRGSFLVKGKLEPITVRFKGETEFGSKIIFVPPYRLFGIGLHPTAGELGALVAAKGGGLARR